MAEMMLDIGIPILGDAVIENEIVGWIWERPTVSHRLTVLGGAEWFCFCPMRLLDIEYMEFVSTEPEQKLWSFYKDFLPCPAWANNK